jgi:hypothetical protein
MLCSLPLSSAGVASVVRSQNLCRQWYKYCGTDLSANMPELPILLAPRFISPTSHSSSILEIDEQMRRVRGAVTPIGSRYGLLILDKDIEFTRRAEKCSV